MIFQDKTYSVLLVSASAKFNTVAAKLLSPTDYWPVITVHSVNEARRRRTEQEFDLILINAPLPDDFGKGFAIDICRESGAGVLLLVKNELYHSTYTEVVEYGVITLPKPTTAQTIAQTLHILCATRERLRQAEAKQASLELQKDEIRLINQAKWILIESMGMNENDAHHYIEKLAMHQRISKREAAENILCHSPISKKNIHLS